MTSAVCRKRKSNKPPGRNSSAILSHFHIGELKCAPLKASSISP
jgi:hypothetical protein